MTRSALRATRRERASERASETEKESRWRDPWSFNRYARRFQAWVLLAAATTVRQQPQHCPRPRYPLMQVYGKASWLRTLPRAHTYRETERQREQSRLRCNAPPLPHFSSRTPIGSFAAVVGSQARSNALRRLDAQAHAHLQPHCYTIISQTDNPAVPTAPQNKLTLARRLIDGQTPRMSWHDPALNPDEPLQMEPRDRGKAGAYSYPTLLLISTLFSRPQSLPV
ncbi:hypothetical protein GQ607_007217 [Colletotrichum asianum]|uniref:Uncharacterized protein n=1 Tax=Colletotrichum asianum TaxID=702518 RepID=A0A8H3ZT89_9PEZI|nr:hypothetical protein GQ607_007217 [Colletotrichum asianum]